MIKGKSALPCLFLGDVPGYNTKYIIAKKINVINNINVGFIGNSYYTIHLLMFKHSDDSWSS